MNTYVIVGFKVSSERSVYYGKAKSIDECLEKVLIAFEGREADFISLRRVTSDAVTKPNKKGS